MMRNQPTNCTDLNSCSDSLVMAFREFWDAFPRPRNKGLSLRYFTEAVESGVAPQLIITAAYRYRGEQAENKIQYVAPSDHWLQNRRWRDYRGTAGSENNLTAISAFWAKRVLNRRYIAPNAISPEIAAHMVSNGMVCEADLAAVGVRLS